MCERSQKSGAKTAFAKEQLQKSTVGRALAGTAAVEEWL
jgi:hypothetical protein